MLSCEGLAFRVMIYFFIILFSFQGELILDMTYGYEVKGRYDRMLDVSIRLNEFGIKTFLPGALLVNELPFCMLSSHFCSSYQTSRRNSSAPYSRLGALYELQATCPDWL